MTKKESFLVGGFAVALLGACAEDTVSPPVAEKIPTELETHGDVRVDNYYWMKERDEPNVIAYLEAENAYKESVMAETAGLRDRLLEELKSRIKEDDSSVPYKHGDYFYYYRYEPDLEYAIYCRRKGSMDAEEEILLDVNIIAGDAEYFAVSGFRVSPDHKKAAFAVDTSARLFFTLRFIDLETGEEISERIEDVTSNFQWAADSETLFYTKQDAETLRWQWIYRTRLGATQDAELVYEEVDPTFSTWAYTTNSDKFVYIRSDSTTSSEVRYIPTDDPAAAPKVILEREKDHEYSVTDGGDRFYLRSNQDAQNFQLFEVPIDDTSREAWSLLIPHRDDVLLQYAMGFSEHVVVSGRRLGLPYIEIIDRVSGETHALDFGEEAYQAFTSNNYEFDTGTLRYQYESMTTPDSVYDYDMSTRERTLVREEEVPGGFNRNDYVSERLLVPARDGTKVPVSLVYRKDTAMDGQNPLLQYGYGAYGASYDPGFSTYRLSLLDRGFIYALAHIRGSSTMGRQWYLDGRQLQKMNTFTDFIDVSEFLVENGYTSPERLYAEGASAGGLLMGVIANMRPELYNGIVAEVPFVDAVTSMLDPSIPLTTGEWEEWGDPREKAFYDYMLAYSPYDQVERQAYPNMLVTSGYHDSQVQYWEPTKWVAKLRDYKTDDNVLLLDTNMQTGHYGNTGRYAYLEDIVLMYAFLLMLEGITE